MCTIKGISTAEFLEEVKSLVVHYCYVVRVPTDRTAYVKHQLRNIKQQRSYHIAYILGLLIMAGIERVHDIVLSARACIEVMRAYRIAFHTDAKEFSFKTSLHIWKIFAKYFIQRLFQNLTITITLYRLILHSVMNPNVHDTRVVLRLTHSIGNTTATFCMFNPELTNFLIRI